MYLCISPSISHSFTNISLNFFGVYVHVWVESLIVLSKMKEVNSQLTDFGLKNAK